ncbi:MAG: hypothetical protein ICV54_27600 [Nostoc sp. C3-bin3]|nr:hypothetical protein [Nostoc sp. C3-bin3]
MSANAMAWLADAITLSVNAIALQINEKKRLQSGRWLRRNAQCYGF